MFVDCLAQMQSFLLRIIDFCSIQCHSFGLGIFAVNGLYAKDNLLGGTREYSKVFRSATQGFLLIAIAGFLEPDFDYCTRLALDDLGIHIPYV